MDHCSGQVLGFYAVVTETQVAVRGKVEVLVHCAKGL